MAYIAPFLRLVVSGTLFTAERFSYSLALIEDFGSASPPSEVPQAVIDAVTTFHTTAGVAHTSAKVDTIKLNEIGTDGRYTSSADTVLHEFTTPVAGVASVGNPSQIAAAISLGTAASRGRASKGRFYIPVGYMIGTDGRLGTAQRDALGAAAHTFVEDLNLAVPGYDVGVVSNIGTGAQRAVTHVRVGRVLDTIRSRRSSLDEDYWVSPALDETGDA